MKTASEINEELSQAVDKHHLSRQWNTISRVLYEVLGVDLDELVDLEIERQTALEGLVKYISGEDSSDGKEYYDFCIRHQDEDDWGLSIRFELQDDMLPYTALTTLRQWLSLGVSINFN